MVCSIGKLYAKLQDYAQDNYYTKNASLENSQWYGQGAETLGLKGQVSTEDYNNAYQGIDHQGNSLRQRQTGKKYNPGRDITLSAPKSVSLLGLVKGDARVIEAQKNAVTNTLKYVEQNCIFTRTGKGGVNRQQTDNALIAIFHHDDNRNQDPQLHSHCVIFNQTQGQDGKWRSMDNRELYQQKMTIGMVYHHELGRELNKLGYELTWNKDGTFEVWGYSPEQLKTFSTRKQEINQAVGKDASAEVKAQACTNTRKGKVYKAAEEREALKEKWQQRAEIAGIKHPSSNWKQITHPVSKTEILTEAINVTSEKQIAFPRHLLFKEVLRQSQGKHSLKELEQELDNHPSLIKTNDERLTTVAAINREKQILHLASSNKNTFTPLADIQTAQKQAQKIGLNQAQSQALIHFVTNKDGVMLCQGDAGVGKTYTVKALQQTIPAHLTIRGLAPSATAAEELQRGTNIPCQTIDAYLQTPFKSLNKNELIAVDEAGMIGSSQMQALLERAKQTNSRLLLIGDTKQLAAVQAGCPFRLLQEQAKLPTVRIDKNVRQQNLQLKEVVDLLATGQIEQGYQQLKENGCIKQMPIDSLRLEAVVKDYLQRDEKQKAQTLILAGTNQEKAKITHQVRQGLINQKKLGQESRDISILKSKDLNKFSLIQASSYEVGDVVKFRQSSTKFNKELYYRVDAIDTRAGTLTLRDSYDTTQILELNRYQDREVFQSQSRELRCGEQMKFTRNQYQNQQKQINGQKFTVLGFESNRKIKISTKGKTQTVTPDLLLYSDYRYADTVHSSQGKTAQYCIYAAGSGNSLTVGRPQLELAGMPIPATYENRGFFLVGSPGSGKTQAIRQMVAVLKQRTDFRGIVFDRGGELLEKFYDPEKDIIFNPFDSRSCHWTHTSEPTRPETIAAGLIPMGLSKEPFFSTAGRAVMSELFRKTQSNGELFELLQGKMETLSSFLSGTLAARYLEEPKAATSVLSTVANYCQFYSALVEPQGKTLSFYRWGESDSPRWIFVTLRENDAELLKPLYSLVFELMLKGLLSNEERIRKTAIVIDELGALNQLPSLHRLLSESRKFLGCPILGTQTEAQITKIYGREDTRIILQGTKTKLILNCADPQTAETMAKIIGKQESVQVTSNRSRTNHKGGQNRTLSENEQIRESYAVIPAELQDLPDLKGYFKMASFPAAAVRVKIKKFSRRIDRFVPRVNLGREQDIIQQQWQDLNEDN